MYGIVCDNPGPAGAPKNTALAEAPTTPVSRRPRQHRPRGCPKAHRPHRGPEGHRPHGGREEGRWPALRNPGKPGGGKESKYDTPVRNSPRIELTSPRAKELRHSRVEAASPYGKKGQKERGKRRGKKSTLRRGCISGQLQANTMRYKLRMRDKSCPAMTSGNIH